MFLDQRLDLVKLSATDQEPVRGQIIVSLTSRDGPSGGNTPLAIVSPTGDIRGPDEEDTENTNANTTERLPEGWEERRTPNGRLYFVNHVTKTTQWERPNQPASESSVHTNEENSTSSGPSRGVQSNNLTNNVIDKNEKRLSNDVLLNFNKIEITSPTRRPLAQRENSNNHVYEEVGNSSSNVTSTPVSPNNTTLNNSIGSPKSVTDLTSSRDSVLINSAENNSLTSTVIEGTSHNTTTTTGMNCNNTTSPSISLSTSNNNNINSSSSNNNNGNINSNVNIKNASNNNSSSTSNNNNNNNTIVVVTNGNCTTSNGTVVSPSAVQSVTLHSREPSGVSLPDQTRTTQNNSSTTQINGNDGTTSTNSIISSPQNTTVTNSSTANTPSANNRNDAQRARRSSRNLEESTRRRNNRNGRQSSSSSNANPSSSSTNAASQSTPSRSNGIGSRPHVDLPSGYGKY